MIELQPYRYDSATGQWRPEDSADPGQPLSDLTVATHNVWFSSYFQEVRGIALLSELAACDADVIALQEVTPPLHEQIRETPWIQRSYALSDPDGRTMERYGVLLLARVPVERFTLHDMPTRMGRKLLCAHLAGSLAVATIHLESLPPSAEYRDEQFKQCVSILDGFDHAVFMGDMNFCSSWAEENQRIPDRYTDVWPHLHPDDPGYTEDTSINPMLEMYERGDKQVRYDRVFLHTRDASWHPVAIARLSTRPIGGDPMVFPSDHFGLAARFERG